MVAEPVRRSRFAWPHREPPEPPSDLPIPPHRHRSARRQWAAIVALYLIVALLTYLVIINYQYVLGRGQYRDQEQARAEEQTTEQIRVAICGLLDGLPTGPVLDPLRVRYECEPGNGIPPEELSPEARQQLWGYRDDAPLTTTDEPFDVNDYYAVPNPRYSASATTRPREKPAGTAEASTPTPTAAPPAVAPDDPAPSPPLIDLPGIDPLCDVLGICP